MKLRRHLGAKIAVLVASAAALGGIWGLVHQNPPPANADTAASTEAPTATPPSRAAPKATQKSAQQAPVRRHARTHVS